MQVPVPPSYVLFDRSIKYMDSISRCDRNVFSKYRTKKFEKQEYCWREILL